MNPVYIVDSIRTPRARANQKGGLSQLNPYELLDVLYKDCLLYTSPSPRDA